MLPCGKSNTTFIESEEFHTVLLEPLSVCVCPHHHHHQQHHLRVWQLKLFIEQPLNTAQQKPLPGRRPRTFYSSLSVPTARPGERVNKRPHLMKGVIHFSCLSSCRNHRGFSTTRLHYWNTSWTTTYNYNLTECWQRVTNTDKHWRMDSII